MERSYLEAIIRLLEDQRELHDSLFVGKAVHSGCIARFDLVLAELRRQLFDLELDERSGDVSALVRSGQA